MRITDSIFLTFLAIILLNLSRESRHTNVQDGAVLAYCICKKTLKFYTVNCLSFMTEFFNLFLSMCFLVPCTQLLQSKNSVCNLPSLSDIINTKKGSTYIFGDINLDCLKGIVSRDWGELQMIPVDSLEVFSIAGSYFYSFLTTFSCLNL